MRSWNIPYPYWMDVQTEVAPYLNQLDPRCREVLLLRIQEYKQDDIAEMMGIAQGTVSKCLSKARQIMPFLSSRLTDGRHHVRPLA